MSGVGVLANSLGFKKLTLAGMSTTLKRVRHQKENIAAPLLLQDVYIWIEQWLHLQPLKKTPLNLGATGGIYAVLFGAIPSPRGARAGES